MAKQLGQQQEETAVAVEQEQVQEQQQQQQQPPASPAQRSASPFSGLTSFLGWAGGASGAAVTVRNGTPSSGASQSQSQHGETTPADGHRASNRSSNSNSNSSWDDASAAPDAAVDSSNCDVSEDGDDHDDADAQWEEAPDNKAGSENEPSVADLLARAWYGASDGHHRLEGEGNSGGGGGGGQCDQLQQQQQSQPSRSKAARSKLLLRASSAAARRRTTSAASTAAGVSSWTVPRLRVPSLLVRAAPGWARPSGAAGAAPGKSLYVRLAEQLLGEGVYRALDAIQDEIIEAEDPLGPATIKFFARAGLGIARSWAPTNLTRSFVAFGACVAASTGAFHAAKVGVKAAARSLAPRCGRAGAVCAPAIAFTADVLLPSSFFGPWMATYGIARLLLASHSDQAAPTDAAAAAGVPEMVVDGVMVESAFMGPVAHPLPPRISSNATTRKPRQQHHDVVRRVRLGASPPPSRRKTLAEEDEQVQDRNQELGDAQEQVQERQQNDVPPGTLTRERMPSSGDVWGLHQR